MKKRNKEFKIDYKKKKRERKIIKISCPGCGHKAPINNFKRRENYPFGKESRAVISLTCPCCGETF